jgi:DNA-binding CsgD family transcriptional regulator
MAAQTSHHGDRAAGRDWKAEYEELSRRDRDAALPPEDLERLGIAAYLAGDESGSISIHSRAHTLALERGELRQAARAAYWISFALIGARDLTRATAWAARARRLLDEDRHDCVERGYVLLPFGLEQVVAGDFTGAEATFTEAERTGERFADADLTSLARQGRGRVLVALGRVAEGVALFDEVMVSVTANEVTPIIAGVVYCSVISACVELLDIRRAHAWTEALDDWCATQRGLVPYRGECLAHRAEIMCWRGQWAEALDQARRACEAQLAAKGARPGAAAYALAELLRLRGDLPAAEEAYQLASAHGRAPYPGLALLRLAQGHTESARAAVERLMAEPASARQRADVLAAAVEIQLAAGNVAAARESADGLQAIAARLPSEWLRAMALSAQGVVLVEESRPADALAPLREALAAWHELGAPYESARVHVALGRACQVLGDADGARLEWEAAAHAFRGCGARPALAAMEALTGDTTPPTVQARDGLTSREVDVLRLVAQGKTNRAIARDLDISEKTVARHVSNIFLKLDLSTRAAATAYAFTHGLAR